MAVVIQEMVPSNCSGVLFTVDPVTGDASYPYIAANFGLGEVCSNFNFNMALVNPALFHCESERCSVLPFSWQWKWVGKMPIFNNALSVTSNLGGEKI